MGGEHILFLAETMSATFGARSEGHSVCGPVYGGEVHVVEGDESAAFEDIAECGAQWPTQRAYSK